MSCSCFFLQKYIFLSFENVKKRRRTLFNYNNLYKTELVISEGNITKILRVDNLIINKDNIWIIDYKSDQITPNKIPLNYKEQLMNYKKAISKIYPNKKITCAILWINDLTLQEVI